MVCGIDKRPSLVWKPILGPRRGRSARPGRRYGRIDVPSVAQGFSLSQVWTVVGEACGLGGIQKAELGNVDNARIPPYSNPDVYTSSRGGCQG
jgi:hypothetical protein